MSAVTGRISPWALVARTSAAAVAGLRPRQWIKNLLLFAGILFAAKTGDAGRWAEAFVAFGAYSAVSSASYLLNDVRDAPHDRLHPVKRRRPVARGDLPPRLALGLAASLALLGLVAGAALGWVAFVLVLAFAALQASYSLALKRLVLVDVAAISLLFVLRAAAGAEAVHVRISPWLLACTALLALFLGLAKRRGELTLVARGDAPGRPVLGRYSVALVDRLLWPTVVATVASYVLYTVAAHDSYELAATVPFVVVGVSRYLHLIHRRDLGEEPENVLFSDKVTLACVALWALTAALVLANS